MGEQVKVKKIKAYPFPVNLKTASISIPGQVVKLTLQGFLAEIGDSHFQPGDRFEVSFEIPLQHHFVTEPGVMVKLYNQWNGGRSGGGVGVNTSGAPAPAGEDKKDSAPASPTGGVRVIHLVEIHFQSLSAENRGHISRFLSATKQTA